MHMPWRIFKRANDGVSMDPGASLHAIAVLINTGDERDLDLVEIGRMLFRNEVKG